MDLEGNRAESLTLALVRDFNNARAHNFVLLRGDSQSLLSVSVLFNIGSPFPFLRRTNPRIFHRGLVRARKSRGFLHPSRWQSLVSLQQPLDYRSWKDRKSRRVPPPFIGRRQTFLRFFSGRLRFIDLRVAPCATTTTMFTSRQFQRQCRAILRSWFRITGLYMNPRVW